MALKYSRQREAIKEFVMNREDHPTADVVYLNVRKEFPNISLGTVYRNLTLLSDLGELSRLRIGDGVDHFDAITMPHYHFICRRCKAVHDLKIPIREEMNTAAAEGCEGVIEDHTAYFYGTCKDCLKVCSN